MFVVYHDKSGAKASLFFYSAIYLFAPINLFNNKVFTNNLNKMEKQFKHIVGEVRKDACATIRLFNDVDEYSAYSFVSEFLWLESQAPNKIKVCINSSGGSVLYGMSIFSVIKNSSVPTECVIEGLAASTASVIWAAGDKSLMCDYGILMIHNPFHSDNDDNSDNDKDVEDVVKAFKQQIETIYVKRFGLSKTKVKAIMDGEDGKDGTFFTAEQAVEAGIIPEANVIKTNKQTMKRVKDAIEGLEDKSKFKDTVLSVCNEIGLEELEMAQNKPLDTPDTNLNKINEVNNLTKTNNMEGNEKDFNYEAVLATLGFKEKADSVQVMKRINDLMGFEAKLKEAEKTIDQLKIEKAGEVAKNNNLSKELSEVKNELKAYKDAEETKRQEEISKLIEDAVSAGKISEESKSSWIEMATSKFDLTKKTLDSIPAREKISDAIQNNPNHIKDVKDGMVDTAKELQNKIDAVVGKDFKFNKFD